LARLTSFAPSLYHKNGAIQPIRAKFLKYFGAIGIPLNDFECNLWRDFALMRQKPGLFAPIFLLILARFGLSRQSGDP